MFNTWMLGLRYVPQLSAATVMNDDAASGSGRHVCRRRVGGGDSVRACVRETCADGELAHFLASKQCFCKHVVSTSTHHPRGEATHADCACAVRMSSQMNDVLVTVSLRREQ